MEIAVKETYAHMLKDESLVQNAETLYIVEFLFDKSWDGYTKTAIFKAGSVELSVKLTDDRCIIPAECLKQAGVSLRIGVSGVKASEEDEAMLKAMQRDAAYMDPTRGAAHLVGAQGDAMRAAAANTSAGPAMAFMGVNAAAAAGGADAQTLYQMGARQAAAQPAPAPAAGWKCACGQSGNTGKFCTACGAPKPEAPTVWVCSCGTKNSGKFCSECGKPRPAAQCANCGWKPADPTRLPKFCPECGKPFGA